MRHTRYTKRQLIEVVLSNIPEQVNYTLNNTISIEDLYIKWFYTGRSEGYRLTDEGYQAFNLAEIEYYQYPIKTANEAYNSHYSFLVGLNKKIKCPYYLMVSKKETERNTIIRNPVINIYDSEVAMMISLHGSLKEYLDSISDK